MSELVERFEKKARFEDESEAELIREKLERFVTDILVEVEKRDKRFQSTLIQSGSVYEGVKVRRPDEFDFMIRIDLLTDKPLFHKCDRGDGYTKLILDEQEWEEFKDDEGFFTLPEIADISRPRFSVSGISFSKWRTRQIEGRENVSLKLF